MKHEFVKRADNVFVIDAGMFGFKNYMSVFLVQGKELALIDTGLPDSLENVRAGIREHGFSVQDINYIFITHEHHDHSGNLAPLMRENPKIKAYISPLGAKWVIDPLQEAANRKQNLSAKMAKRFADMEPVPADRLNILKDGDAFDLGDGVRLKVTFTPGHQPGGVVIMEEKHKGLFINDLVGNCFADCDCQLILNPPLSDMWTALEFMKKVEKWDVKRLFMGHFGISEEPRKIIKGAIDRMQELIDTCDKCVAEGKQDQLIPRVYDVKMKEVVKLKARGPELYDYMMNELIDAQAKIFTEMYLNKMAK